MALSGIFGYKLPNISQFSASSGPPPLTTFLKPCAAHRKAGHAAAEGVQATGTHQCSMSFCNGRCVGTSAA